MIPVPKNPERATRLASLLAIVLSAGTITWAAPRLVLFPSEMGAQEAPPEGELATLVEAAETSLAKEDRGAARRSLERALESLSALEEASAGRQREALVLRLAEVAKRTHSLELQRRAWEWIHAYRERVLEREDAGLQEAHRQLAILMAQTGDLARATEILEDVVAVYATTREPEDELRLRARFNLATAIMAQGDHAAAREQYEILLEVYERTRPEEDRALSATRINLAQALREMGEPAAARPLEERVLAIYERTQPPDNLNLQKARLNLALTLSALGDPLAARSLLERALPILEGTLATQHPDLRRARLHLALVAKSVGDLEAARILEETLLASTENLLAASDPGRDRAWRNLAFTHCLAGRYAEALVVTERVLEALTREVGEHNPQTLRARMRAARLARHTADPAQALTSDRALVAELEARLPQDDPGLAAARLQLARSLRSEGDLPAALELQRQAAIQRERSLPDSDPLRLDAYVETARTVLVMQHKLGLLEGLAAVTKHARLVGRELGHSGITTWDPFRLSSVDGAVGLFCEVLAHGPRWVELAFQKREDLRTIQNLTAGSGSWAKASPAVPARAVLIAYSTYSQTGYSQTGTRPSPGAPIAPPLIVAVSLVHSGTKTPFVVVSEARDVQAAVQDWREALAQDGEALERAGTSLRKLLLDPVLATIGEDVRTLIVCSDVSIEGLALDALPLEQGFVGDRYRVLNLLSVVQLMEPSGSPKKTSLIAVGPELDTELAALFEEKLGDDSGWMPMDDLDADILVDYAQRASHLHIALPLYGSDSVSSPLRSAALGLFAIEREDLLLGLSPLTNAGIVIGGSSEPAFDTLGRRTGVLSARELSGLDLSRCQLAVLTEWGPGLRTVRSALHTAGARMVIGPLWETDPTWAGKLLVKLYENLLTEELEPDRALWQAKRALRDAGAPVREWSGWACTGGAE